MQVTIERNLLKLKRCYIHKLQYTYGLYTIRRYGTAVAYNSIIIPTTVEYQYNEILGTSEINLL